MCENRKGESGEKKGQSKYSEQRLNSDELREMLIHSVCALFVQS